MIFSCFPHWDALKKFQDYNEKNIWRCSPKYANLDEAKIDVKESEIESFEMIKQLF
jgi:hypothetical protein